VEARGNLGCALDCCAVDVHNRFLAWVVRDEHLARLDVDQFLGKIHAQLLRWGELVALLRRFVEHVVHKTLVFFLDHARIDIRLSFKICQVALAVLVDLLYDLENPLHEGEGSR